MRKISAPTQVFFVVLFVLLVLVSRKINFSALVGAEQNQFFTLFQFFGPMAGGILGPLVGAAVVFSSLTADFFIKLVTAPDSASFNVLTLLRFLPAIFAAWYFGVKKGKLSFGKKNLSPVASIGVPLVAIALFVLHPVAREAWYFSLFWTIPIIAYFFRHRLFLRSLGATFAAHSVGGAIWVWTVPMTPEMWTGLIPVVIVERVLFALGIGLSFIIASTVLARVESRVPFVSVEKHYDLLSGNLRALFRNVKRYY